MLVEIEENVEVMYERALSEGQRYGQRWRDSIMAMAGGPTSSCSSTLVPEVDTKNGFEVGAVAL